jgi:hypothetical protein
VKPQPREGGRNAALSATGVSNGTFDVEVLLRAKRVNALGADVVDCDFTLNVTRLTGELSDDADPALL